MSLGLAGGRRPAPVLSPSLMLDRLDISMPRTGVRYGGRTGVRWERWRAAPRPSSDSSSIVCGLAYQFVVLLGQRHFCSVALGCLTAEAGWNHD